MTKVAIPTNFLVFSFSSNTLSFIFIASMSHGRSKSGINMKVVHIEKVVHRQVY